MKVICITTTKGGAAKTTNTVEIAGALSTYGKKVLCIDVDQTSGLSKYLGVRLTPEERENYGIKTSLEVLTGNGSIEESIIELDNMDIICGDARFEKASQFFQDEDEDKYLLKDLCDEIAKSGKYDYIFIDHGPQNDIVKKMALIAADEFYITSMISDVDRDEAKRSIDNIVKLQHTRDKLVSGQIKGVILSSTSGKALKEMALEDIEGKINQLEDGENLEYNVHIFDIPQSMAIKEAQTYQVPNTIKHKSSSVSRNYYEIADYIMEGEA
ncbi:ParA family protein [Pseudobutyrivibrio xylanivorans]|uniref:ParA family protein n=1 Tax=Pseudobutyrivibrio xylanivorans TaxID=185007 RepID=A0A5P6VLW6_PSEXY|nr:ParA family protein [Pseudobutyrivibrio xylanivorans]QFJ53402.1 ParA family protein [Pseudobutyrivibrio xylanivorans]QFJ53479.1 ParA family protein [Pseudobutyrivibrio xylanivorans]